jgi:hypothetical protein
MYISINKLFIYFIVFVLSISNITFIKAQNLESTNYRLIAPSTEPINGIIDSPSYSALVDSSPVNDFRADSTTYSLRGGTASNITPNVPLILCFETNTNTGTCSIGSNGMQEVCSIPGCYDRAKFRIDTQNNPDDARYAIQISTTSDFSANVKFVDATTRLLKNTLTINDFRFKCEWEGDIFGSYCISANTTWQRYNVLGLTEGTQYYIRAAALHGSSTNGTFTQSEWGPAVTASTVNTSISFDIDISNDYILGSSVPPHLLNIPNIMPETVTNSSEYIILRYSSNALGGTLINVRGSNGALQNGLDTIANVNGDLDILASGYGLRNISASNTSTYPSFIGSPVISSSPSDFTDTPPVNKVGSPTTSYVQLLNSGGLPIHTARSAFMIKAKAPLNIPTGTYTETLTFIPVSTY